VALDPAAAGMPGSAAVLRHVMGHFVSGVSVATTVLDGVAHALTATAVSSVSLHPPLVLLCVGRSSRFHSAVTTTGEWALSVLAADQSHLARHFSVKGRDLLSQFDAVPHAPAPASKAPVLTGCLAWLDLRTWAAYDGGDHTIVVGEVVAGSEESPIGGPLTYYQGSYSPRSGSRSGE
jgi:flavin reductase (DIM6/NTAB) family NADH-FMN oxidoreductase RutF